MPTLFEIGDDMRALNDALEGGELSSPEVEAAWLAEMERLHHDEAAKLDGWVDWIRRDEMIANAAQQEAERYLDIARAAKNRNEWKKARLKDYLLLTERKSIRTATGRTVAVQGNGGSVPVRLADAIDPATIPDEFAIVRRSPDLEAIRKHLEAGGSLPFAELGVRGTSLRIR